MIEEASAQELLRVHAQIKGRRQNFDNQWTQLQPLLWADGGDFNTKTTQGERRTRELFETTGAESLEKHQAIMETLHTPRYARWHSVVPSDPELAKDPEVKAFFEQVDDVLFKFRNSPRARFYGQMGEYYKSLGAYGNANLFVDAIPSGGIRYKYTHIGDSWIDTNFEGVVDTVHYEYQLTARAAMQRWGDKAPESVRTAASVDPLAMFEFVHVVRPNEGHDPERIDDEAMAFESFEIAVTDQAIIEKSGYEELPYIWGRYTVNPAEIYGRGPGMLALPIIQTLQEMEKVHLRSGHKVADPPLLVGREGALGRGAKRVRIAPGGLNFGGVDRNGRPTIIPLQTGARLDLTEAMMERKRESIRDLFLVNLFDLLVQDRTQMTATEVLERAREKGQLLSPIVGRQQSETLGPLITREIGIAQRQGALPDLPEILVEAEGEYEIEYSSTATRMQKADDVAAVQRWFEVMAPYAERDPNVLDNLKIDDMARYSADALGVPSNLVNSEQEKRAISDAQAAAAEEQAQLEQAQAGAGVVRDLSAAQAAAA